MSNDLVKIIESNLRGIHTSQYDLSFNELADMYESGELTINPDFQRLFRWSNAKQSRFIESLILEMPIPPIYVTETAEKQYDLIDGLQRISSYLHFRGTLRNAEHLDIGFGDKLELTDCDIISELDGITFDDLPSSLQIRVKRSFIRMQIIKKDSDPMFRYHMFKRLNTGGEILEEQEVRNCTIRILDTAFPDFLKKLSSEQSFKSVTDNVSDLKSRNAYTEELILKFFAFKNNSDNYVKNIGDFLDDYMESVALPKEEENHVTFNYNEEEIVFRKVFKILSLSMGEQAFSSNNKAQDGLQNNFRSYHYEVFPQALIPLIDVIDTDNNEHIRLVREVITEIKLDPDFISMTTGGGKNTKNALDQRIAFASNKLSNIEFKND
ncbi:MULTISPECIES: DUF262 domain-containing protein [unclassified Psychrobacter]|uniref:DUF262 domain-containing protein n=1 Tax=unclassified Psychrobacter TaxID=196806 RepID=UPI00071580FD|nr:DUF262 domain-containing protein [Psychrobacter sp. P11F6]KRG32622.1 hypothetical protein AK822_14085 [Psychrobacter sp. P11F6]